MNKHDAQTVYFTHCWYLHQMKKINIWTKFQSLDKLLQLSTSYRFCLFLSKHSKVCSTSLKLWINNLSKTSCKYRLCGVNQHAIKKYLSCYIKSILLSFSMSAEFNLLYLTKKYGTLSQLEIIHMYYCHIYNDLFMLNI